MRRPTLAVCGRFHWAQPLLDPAAPSAPSMRCGAPTSASTGQSTPLDSLVSPLISPPTPITTQSIRPSRASVFPLTPSCLSLVLFYYTLFVRFSSFHPTPPSAFTKHPALFELCAPMDDADDDGDAGVHMAPRSQQQSQQQSHNPAQSSDWRQPSRQTAHRLSESKLGPARRLA